MLNTMLFRSFSVLVFLAFTRGFKAQTHPLYRCLTLDGKDHFVSRWLDCEGQRDEFLLGYVFDAPQAVVPTPAIYRCLTEDGDHFTSISLECEGQRDESLLGYVYTSQPSNVATKPLYRCITLDGSDHFVSNAVNCEGHRTESLHGYIRVEA